MVIISEPYARPTRLDVVRTSTPDAKFYYFRSRSRSTWKTDTKVFLLLGIFFVLYGSYNWKLLRDFIYRRWSSDNPPSEPWTCFVAHELWVLIGTLVAAWLTGNFLNGRLRMFQHRLACCLSGQKMKNDDFAPALTNEAGTADSSVNDPRSPAARQAELTQTVKRNRLWRPYHQTEHETMTLPDRIHSTKTTVRPVSPMTYFHHQDFRQSGTDLLNDHAAIGSTLSVSDVLTVDSSNDAAQIDLKREISDSHHLNLALVNSYCSQREAFNEYNHDDVIGQRATAAFGIVSNQALGQQTSKVVTETQGALDVAWTRKMGKYIQEEDQRSHLHDSNAFSSTSISGSTQTEDSFSRGLSSRPLTSSACTMTESCDVDKCVGTHSRPCKMVRHCGTATTGPFMKKLRRAQRLLVDAKGASKQEETVEANQYRQIILRYKAKIYSLERLLANKDLMLGCITSRITVLRNETKEAMLVVRTTRERLKTQCKLNAALMDVIESKSENPIYSAGLTEQGSGFKQELRAP